MGRMGSVVIISFLFLPPFRSHPPKTPSKNKRGGRRGREEKEEEEELKKKSEI